MKSWNELDKGILAWMELLGNFSPTVNAESREIKGYMHDEDGGGKVYLNSSELRSLAYACNAVASWLDARFHEQSEHT